MRDITGPALASLVLLVSAGRARVAWDGPYHLNLVERDKFEIIGKVPE